MEARVIKFRIIRDNKIIGYERFALGGWEWTLTMNPEEEDWYTGVFIGAEDCKRSQFTGLLDKHRKEIYEGDLMLVLDRDWPSGDGDPQIHMRNIASICEVVFHNGCFQLIQRKGHGYFTWDLAQTHGRDIFEVIGNIYSNPELIK